jgi:adenosine deaminase
MEKDQIQTLIDNASEDFLERFYETLLNEINSDDEQYHKKAYHLLVASLRSEDPDDFFISLCGWSLESLIERSETK